MWSLATRRPATLGDVINGRGLDRYFDDVLRGWPFDQAGTLTSAWSPACDVSEGTDAVKIVVELPGVKPEDVKLTLEHNLLTIRGEKKQQAEERTERVHRYERSYGSFERRFALPSTVDADRIEAGFDQGILTISLPKAERAKPREIAVNALKSER